MMELKTELLYASRTKIFAVAASTCILYTSWKLVRAWTRPWSSPLRVLRGPKTKSFLMGNVSDIMRLEASTDHEEWTKEFGNVFNLKGFLNQDHLFLMDMRAVNHVLTHSLEYQKPEESRKALAKFLGDGILVAEGEQHRQQRKFMNHSFGAPSIREFVPLFFQEALQLRDILVAKLPADGNSKRIEMLSWLSRATLDIIGIAGFNYRFNALDVDNKPNELSIAFSTMFNMVPEVTLFMILAALIRPLQSWPTERKRNEDRAMATMMRIGRELLQDRKRVIIDEEPEDDDKQNNGVHGKDLLSALVKANMSTDIPVSQRMSDDSVVSQIPTFFIAGHETSSTQLTWCLFCLAQYPQYQTRLREELLAVPSDTPSMDELQALPFLDAVIRETMRLHPAVPYTARVAMSDSVIPLNEPFIDKNGISRSEVHIRAGETVFIPGTCINRWTQIWGADAQEFNPGRWSNLPEAVSTIPGVWANLLTFLGGPRSCIGFRFALVEMKAILFTLLRAMEFELAVPADDVDKRTFITTRPFLKSDKNGPAQLPLLVKVHLHSSD